MAARLSQLQATLEDLGLQAYHNHLVENGFDTWDSLADITEADMATLGFKLGHRRKLQREVAGRAGHPTVEPLFGISASTPQSSTKAQHSEELIKNKSIHARRRYRKRPLRDPRAPTRPDTGYVAYSRFLRQNPEISNHSFVEVARFVGAQWSCLSREEKDVWNSRAAAQKQLYYTKLTEYRNKAYQVDGRQTEGKKLLQSPLKIQINRTKVSGVPDDCSSTPSSNNSCLFPEACYVQTDQYPTPQNSTTCADEANFLSPCNMNTFDGFATASNEVGRVPLLDSIWTIISRECGSDLAAQSLRFDQEDLSPYAWHHSALSKSFHVQAINPFEFQTKATVWPMIESFLQIVNSIYYLVNPNLLLQHLNSAFLADQSISNCTMSMLCICIGIGCQYSDKGTDDLALMWYENGRRYLDDHDWCINLAVMQALALIGMFHIGQRPSTSSHYLDAATRIGESNNLHKITPHGSQPADHSEWLHIWETIQTMHRASHNMTSVKIIPHSRSTSLTSSPRF
ncbi:hypothetical protein F5884DRAFT_399879 [Xylogone sp. PMI_703]|nr:hypothetical protein F5884DRAFT_399879 [Xylogone sp. PMI_703]